MMPTWVGADQKFDFFVQKNWFLCSNKHFRQNIINAMLFFALVFETSWKSFSNS